MCSRKVVLIILFPVLFCFHSVAQVQQSLASRHLTKADLHEYLLYKSKKEKSKAIGTAIVGPVLTGVGIYLYNKENRTTGQGTGSLIGTQNNSSPAKILGILIGSLGISTTISSIPLFISAANARRVAKLVLSDRSISYLNTRISVPSVGLNVNF